MPSSVPFRSVRPFVPAKGCPETRGTCQLLRAVHGIQPAQMDTKSPPSDRYRVRQAKESESPQVARLCAEVFGPMTFQAVPAFLKVPDSVKQQAGVEIYKDVDFQLSKALQSKRKATREAREYKLAQLASALRSELARLSGSAGANATTTPTTYRRQALRRWSRSRQFICLVAEALQLSGLDLGTGPAASKSTASIDPMQNVAMLTLAAPQNSWETARPQSHLSTGPSSRLESSTAFRSSQAGNEIFSSQQIFSHMTLAAQPLQDSMDHLIPSFSGGSSPVEPQHREASLGFPAEHISRFRGGSVAGENSQLAFDTTGTQTTQLAEDEGLDAEAGSQIVGCAVVSILAPEALLPPPFPSAAPLRCCISNLATSAAHRKKGIATMLVKRCESVARRWGFEDIWLHTDVGNTTAQALYKACGFSEYKRDPVYMGPFRRILLRKAIAPLPGRSCGHDRAEVQLESSNRESKGAYRWRVTDKD